LWLQVDVSEQDQGALHLGQVAEIKIDAYAQEIFSGKVSFIAPVINDKTRTVRVRLELPNKEAHLRPGMYANVIISDVMKPALTIPLSAVIDSGTRQVVLVQVAEGSFQPRYVQLGARNEQYVAVLDGLNESESVVTSANFLIDAESNLKAALGGFGNVPAKITSPDEVKKVALPSTNITTHKQVAKQQSETNTEGHQAQGTLNSINADGTVSISHEPIKSLGWPGMTMNFALSKVELAEGIQVGSKISFELFERKQGEWVIRKMRALGQPQHEGH
jgi:Cu(I)/Ag(I) efflux system membrane fusion protein